MSTAIAPLPIHLFCDLAAPGNLLDLNRNQPPEFYRGDDIEIDIGIGEDGLLLAPSLTGITSVICQVFASENDTNQAMMTCTVLVASMNLALTQTNWNAGGGANSHARFIFANGVTAISLGGAASVNYWLRITLQTSDATSKTITLQTGFITVKDGPIANRLPGFNIGTVNGVSVLQILDSGTGTYYTLSIFSDAGVETLQVNLVSPYVGTQPAWRTFVVGGVSVLQLLDAGTNLYHTLSCVADDGAEALEISDQGY
jgi:hypothetical protein